MLPPRRAAIEGSGLSSRTWVRLRAVHNIINLHGRRAGTCRATWAIFQHLQLSGIHPNSYTIQRTAETNTELSLTKNNFLVLTFSNSKKQHANSTSVKSRQQSQSMRLCLKSASTGQRKHSSLLSWATTLITPPLFQSPSQTPANGLFHTILNCPVLNFPLSPLQHSDTMTWRP